MAPRHLLLQRDFGLYWFASLSATSGLWLWRIAGPVLLFEMTDSALMLGAFSLAAYGPVLALSFVGGVLADRFPRRALIGVTQLASAGVFAAMAVLAATVGLSPGAILGAAVADGVAYALAKPGLQALVAELVPPGDLNRAVAINTAQFTIAQLVGPSVATALLVGGDAVLALAVASALYVPLVVAMARVRSRPDGGEARSADRGRALLRGGIEALRAPTVGPLLAVIAAGSIAMEGAVRVLAPQFATEALGLEETTAGLLITGQALGAAAAIALVGRAERAVGDLRAALAALLLMAPAIVVYSVAPNLAVAMGVAALVGAGQTLSFSLVTGRIHRATAPDRRGRVMAVHSMALLGTRPLSGLAAGLVASAAGARMAAGVFALVALAGVALVRVAARPSAVTHPIPVLGADRARRTTAEEAPAP